jgi:hypothetical protein
MIAEKPLRAKKDCEISLDTLPIPRKIPLNMYKVNRTKSPHPHRFFGTIVFIFFVK